MCTHGLLEDLVGLFLGHDLLLHDRLLGGGRGLLGRSLLPLEGRGGFLLGQSAGFLQVPLQLIQPAGGVRLVAEVCVVGWAGPDREGGGGGEGVVSEEIL